MQFRILGPLEVVRDGRSLDLGRPKQRSVLAILLAHADRVVSLDQMIDLLWGGEGAARATSVLQVYISNLRRTLEPDRAPRALAQVLMTQAPGYRLRVDPDDLDSARFEALATQGHQLLAASRPAAARQVLAEALALWRGAALAEFSFEEFAQGEAARLEELRAVATEARIEAELALGHHANVVPDLEALIGRHPFRERLWGLLMLALYRSGRQAEALRAFSACRRSLGDELGIDPGPALRRLEGDILNQSADLEWRPPAEEQDRLPDAGHLLAQSMAATEEPPACPPGSPGGPPASGDLVGRAPELDRLAAVVDGVIAGRGRLALISGEPGIGKTRLVEELSARIGHKFGVVWGRCHEGDGAPPYWPWTDALGALITQCDRRQLSEMVGAAAGELAEILPAIKTLDVELVPSPPLDPAAARFRLHQAIFELLSRLAAQRPLVVVLDDLHWADVASLELLRFVADRVQRIPVLMIATYRDPDPGGSEALPDVLGALARLPGLQRVALGGLSLSDVARFVVQATDVEPSPAALAALHARTEGNPFFVAELARLMVSEGLLNSTSPAAPALQAVPIGVRDVIRSRLARLPQETNEFLVLGAVLGRDFDLRVLAVAGQVETDAALDIIDPALAAGLVHEDDTEVGRFRFSHGLVRDTMYGGLSAFRRVRLHARVAEALEVCATGRTPMAELASHFFLAAAILGPERGFTYAVRAADAAQGVLAYEEVEDQLRRALQLLAMMPAGPDRSELELGLQNRLATLLAMTRGYGAPEVGRAWSRAHELCQEVDDSERLFGALWGLGTLHTARAEFQLVKGVAVELLTVGEQRSSPMWLMAGHFFVGITEFHTGPLPEARRSFATARQWAGSLDLSTAVADAFSQHPAVICLGYLASATCLVGEIEQARDCQAESFRIATALRHPHTLAAAFVADSALAVLRADPEAAGVSADQGLRVCQGHDFPMMEAWLMAYRGWARAALGAVDAGVADMTHAIEAHNATGARIFTTQFMALLADIERSRGHVDRARALVEEALAIVVAGEDSFYEIELYRLRAELFATLGPDHREEAAHWLRHAIGLADDRGAQLLRHRAEAALAGLGDAAPGGAPSGGAPSGARPSG